MEEQRIEAVRQKRMMEEMIETDGWKLLMDIAKTQVDGRTNQVLLKPTENPYQQEYQKGEVQGIKTFCEIPKVLIEHSKAIIEASEEERIISE